MTSRRLTDYFEDAQTVSAVTEHILADLNVNFVHIALGAIETRKAQSFWTDKVEWDRALDALCLFEERLLMDATDRIVSEVRALRDGALTPPEAIDPSLNPYTLPLSSLRTIDNRLQTVGATIDARVAQVQDTLVEIRDAIAQLNQQDLSQVVTRLDDVLLLLAAL